MSAPVHTHWHAPEHIAIICAQLFKFIIFSLTKVPVSARNVPAGRLQNLKRMHKNRWYLQIASHARERFWDDCQAAASHKSKNLSYVQGPVENGDIWISIVFFSNKQMGSSLH